MGMGFQVIRFHLLDFEEEWERTVLMRDYAIVLYKAGKQGGRLAVAAKDATGTLYTYRFHFAAKEEMFVIDQVVHIPARCLKKESGNTIPGH